MTDLIIVLVVLAIVGAAGRYIYKAKKSGAKCIGCAVGGGCGSCHSTDGESADCGCGCGCGCQSESK